ncbi:hypothetical protein jhhlp_005792 [Lomentospora prolificans]|uniref:Uncharacterized protein n=1 Tax=Lomentospora prolificans TaxID=41688 RepID=A0A2N3N463_9PEZI|nr:hypothetical protein jhhlp_005792 [Lomentospora prolificans]
MPRHCRHRCSQRNDPERRGPAHLTSRLELSKRLQLFLLLANLAVAVPVAIYIRATRTGSTHCLPGAFTCAATALAVTTYVAYIGKLRGGYKSAQFLKKVIVADAFCIVMQAFALANLGRVRSLGRNLKAYHHAAASAHPGKVDSGDALPSSCTLPKISLILTILVTISYIHTIARSTRLLASLRRQPTQSTTGDYRASNTDEKGPMPQPPTECGSAPGATHGLDTRIGDLFHDVGKRLHAHLIYGRWDIG